MIIPIKCFTCGEVLADKYRYYLEQVRKLKIQRGIQRRQGSVFDPRFCR